MIHSSRSSLWSRQASPLTPALLVLLAIGVDLFAVSVHSFLVSTQTDFHAFYAGGRGWLEGASMYANRPRLNLSPPWMSAFVFGPLALMSLKAAEIVWTALGVAALAAATRVIAQEVCFSTRQTLWFAALTLTSHSVQLIWGEGQTIAILAYPATLAWRAWRHREWRRAGLWLAPVVAAKPPLALIALWLGWPTLVVTAIASATIGLGGALITGLAPWLEWLGVSAQMPGSPNPANVSLWGFATRMTTGTVDPVVAWALPASTTILVVAGIAAITWSSARAKGDARWATAVCWSALISPVGWVYYLPVGLGAIAAIWRPTAPWLVAIALLAVPIHVLRSVGEATNSSILTGSVYTCGAVSLWYAAVSARDQGVDKRLPVSIGRG